MTIEETDEVEPGVQLITIGVRNALHHRHIKIGDIVTVTKGLDYEGDIKVACNCNHGWHYVHYSHLSILKIGTINFKTGRRQVKKYANKTNS